MTDLDKLPQDDCLHNDHKMNTKTRAWKHIQQKQYLVHNSNSLTSAIAFSRDAWFGVDGRWTWAWRCLYSALTRPSSQRSASLCQISSLFLSFASPQILGLGRLLQ